jgi:hypothetical protein
VVTERSHQRLRWLVLTAAVLYAALLLDFSVMAFADDAAGVGLLAGTFSLMWALIALGVIQRRSMAYTAAMAVAGVDAMRLLLVSFGATALWALWFGLALGVVFSANRLRSLG